MKISKLWTTDKGKKLSNKGSSFSHSLVPRELNDSTRILKSSLVLPELNKTTSASVVLQ